jgi:hypothetical protein
VLPRRPVRLACITYTGDQQNNWFAWTPFREIVLLFHHVAWIIHIVFIL